MHIPYVLFCLVLFCFSANNLFCFVLFCLPSIVRPAPVERDMYVCIHPYAHCTCIHTFNARPNKRAASDTFFLCSIFFVSTKEVCITHKKTTQKQKKKDTPRGHPTRGQRERQGVGAQSHPCCAGSRLPLPALAPVFFCFCFCFCFCFWFLFWFFSQVSFVGSGAWG